MSSKYRIYSKYSIYTDENAKRGKEVLRNMVDHITAAHDDTEAWSSDRWEEAIEEELCVLHDKENGIDDLCALMAHMISVNDADDEQTARIACHGVAHVIAEALEAANAFCETCYLLD